MINHPSNFLILLSMLTPSQMVYSPENDKPSFKFPYSPLNVNTKPDDITSDHPTFKSPVKKFTSSKITTELCFPDCDQPTLDESPISTQNATTKSETSESNQAILKSPVKNFTSTQNTGNKTLSPMMERILTKLDQKKRLENEEKIQRQCRRDDLQVRSLNDFCSFLIVLLLYIPSF